MVFGFSSLFIFDTALAEPIKELTQYGSFIVRSVEPGAVRFSEVVHTMANPLNSYVIKFSTENSDLLAAKNADKSEAARAENMGKTLVWEARFCSDDLISIMKKNDIDVVFGQLFSRAGEIQFIAGCYPNGK